ncbi:hypothetical protein RA267_27665, partial [Pseudomonas syringae pv. tagetis]|uniref:hypothetical protein n=1 Tax=Pseudomonas syringae group genomosp. 7 TaxID=251699 RepID=UPI00376FCF47
WVVVWWCVVGWGGCFCVFGGVLCCFCVVVLVVGWGGVLFLGLVVCFLVWGFCFGGLVVVGWGFVVVVGFLFGVVLGGGCWWCWGFCWCCLVVCLCGCLVGWWGVWVWLWVGFVVGVGFVCVGAGVVVWFVWVCGARVGGVGVLVGGPPGTGEALRGGRVGGRPRRPQGGGGQLGDV